MTPALSGEELFARLMLAMAVVIIVARIGGILVARIGQPRVMGELVAGILLGPSLLEKLAPQVSGFIFPGPVVAALTAGADIGLAFYMFLVGLELDARLLKGRLRQAAVISNASVIVPMALGLAIAIPLHATFGGPKGSLPAFALFMGVSMSITAFPVLARILVERRMIQRPVGVIAMASAAVDDVTAWGLLALATAVAGATTGSEDPVLKTARILALAILFVTVMLTVVRRLLARLAIVVDEAGHVPTSWLGIVFVAVLLSGAVAGHIGIAPIFGAFVLGIVMPRREALTRDVSHRLEDFVAIVLLPLFFVVAGLKADVFKVATFDLIGLTLLLVTVAIAAKFLSAAVAARLTGATGREALAVGALMNTRGLTELIVLNIALNAEIIGRELFTMLVIMALVTTFMTGPLLRLIDPRGEMASAEPETLTAPAPAPADAGPVAVPDRAILVAALEGRNLGDLLTIARALARGTPLREVVAVRLLEPSAVATGIAELDRRYREALAELEAERAMWTDEPPLRTAALSSLRPSQDLIRLAGPDRVDLVLVDGRRPIVGGGVLGGPIQPLLEEAVSDVAVLVRREELGVLFGTARPVIVPFGGAEHDWAALELGAWIASSTRIPLRLLGAAGLPGRPDEDPTRLLANASVVLQQMAGVTAETQLVDVAGGGLLPAVEDASLLVVGLSPRWRTEGLGNVRSTLMDHAAVPVLFVRRGSRPGALAPSADMTRFTWSYVGSEPVDTPGAVGRTEVPSPPGTSA
jgi:Kef-type K+ transport system membrane component KefB/nucleotide-binding universal stress UspA family protein